MTGLTATKEQYEKAKKWSDPEYCLAAVSNNWYALQHVKEQTAELCMTAVSNNGNAV